MHKESFSQQPEEAEQLAYEPAVQPYVAAARNEFVLRYPQQTETIDTIVDEFTRQGHENFSIFASAIFPDVSFTYTTINVTEIAQALANQRQKDKIADNSLQEEMFTESHRPHLYIANFPGSAPPSDSHAFSASDVVLHKIISELPRIARAMHNHEPVPEVEILMPGGPDALGGTISKEFFNKVDQQGFKIFGELYAEFLERTLPSDISENENSRLELDGYSQGAVIASEIVNYLDPSLKKKTQTLLDNPAGNHEPGILNSTIKGLQIPLLLQADVMLWRGQDTVSKEFNKNSSAFRQYISNRHGLDPEHQKWLKRAMFTSKGLHLMHGAPIDTEAHRHFIRESLKDPLGTGVKRFLRARESHEEAKSDGNTRSLMGAKDQGQSFTSLTEQTEGHVWTFQFYDKWNRRLQYVNTHLGISSPQTEAE